MAGMHRHMSVLMWNVNGLNSPIKRHGLNQKQDLTMCCLQETHRQRQQLAKGKRMRKSILHKLTPKTRRSNCSPT